MPNHLTELARVVSPQEKKLENRRRQLAELLFELELKENQYLLRSARRETCSVSWFIAPPGVPTRVVFSFPRRFIDFSRRVFDRHEREQWNARKRRCSIERDPG
jgi:hypothetical protein